jgi:hypothetical protein
MTIPEMCLTVGTIALAFAVFMGVKSIRSHNAMLHINNKMLDQNKKELGKLRDIEKGIVAVGRTTSDEISLAVKGALKVINADGKQTRLAIEKVHESIKKELKR